MAAQQCPVTCQQCGITFSVPPFRLAAAKYCSTLCQCRAYTAQRWTLTLAERFWQKVAIGEPDACWLWQASCDPAGYGMFAVNRRPLKAHRIVWTLLHGDLPEGSHVRHTCDNPPCVNPAHLIPGTRSDNIQDMVKKGRNSAKVKPEKIARGEQINTAKVTEADVLAIRALYRHGGITYKQIGQMRGLAASTVHKMIRGISWKHLPL